MAEQFSRIKMKSAKGAKPGFEGQQYPGRSAEQVTDTSKIRTTAVKKDGIDVTSKSPDGDLSVVTLIRTDTKPTLLPANQVVMAMFLRTCCATRHQITSYAPTYFTTVERTVHTHILGHTCVCYSLPYTCKICITYHHINMHAQSIHTWTWPCTSLDFHSSV